MITALLAIACFAQDPVLAARVSYPGTVTSDFRWWDLEVLYDEGRYPEGLTAAKQARQSNPKDADLYWLQIRFMFEIAEGVSRLDKSFDKVAWYTEMLNLANLGLAIAPDHGHLLYARGIAAGRLGTTKGVLASLGSAKGIEADWQRVSSSGFAYSSIGGQEVLPCDAHLTLAIFYRLVPDWWIVQVLAGTRGDLQKSADYGAKADRCSPGRILIVKELGVSQLCLGQNTKDPAMEAAGTATLKRALTLPIVSDKTDRIDLQHVRMLLEDPSLACEYSRDGQQELDESKLPPK
ncbi:MAG: hypothetical protein H0V89_10045 [Deltaproteobacteria bacterium]|nr:hypothetical protein [Deltaproteobacteria bacterium]